MNALNINTPVTLRTYPPLVVALGRGFFAWVQLGLGFTLDTRGAGQWQPMVDAVGIGGSVLNAQQVDALVEAYGKPVLG